MIVTPIYAGLLSLLFLVLSYRVILLRGHGASLGDGGTAVTFLLLLAGCAAVQPIPRAMEASWRAAARHVAAGIIAGY